MEQQWGHTVPFVDGLRQRARAHSRGALATGEWGREKPSWCRGCWSPGRLRVPWGGACAALQNPSTEWGLIRGSGVQLGLMGIGACCEQTVRVPLGFSSCFCGDGNLPGSLINWGLGRKLLFQSLVFAVLLLLVWMSLCVIDPLGKGGCCACPAQGVLTPPVCLCPPFLFVCLGF